MSSFRSSFRRSIRFAQAVGPLVTASALVIVAAGCSSDAPTSVESVEIRAAPGGTEAAVTVRTTDPPAAPQNVTFDLRVLGSGYDDGSVVSFELAGAPTSDIITNSTSFISQRELAANVTVGADAEVTLYDVVVTTRRGKRGVGIESFEVISYELMEVGALPGAVTAAANDVNANGEVVGWSFSFADGFLRAIYWHAGVIEDLGPGFALAISSTCTVGACRVVGFRDSRPVVWEKQSGVWTSFELPVTGAFGSAWAINARGDLVAGNMDTGTGTPITVVWTEAGGAWTATPLPPASDASNGYGINDFGQVVGRAGLSAMVWTNSGGEWTATPLDPPPGFVSDEALARAINNLGDVIGEVGPLGGDQTTRAVLWRRAPAGWDRGMDLGILGRSTGQFFEGSQATDINDAGQVVGLSGVKGQRFLRHPFVWTHGSGMMDIGAFRGPNDAIAFGISENGWIVGTDNEQAILWVPTPIP